MYLGKILKRYRPPHSMYVVAGRMEEPVSAVRFQAVNAYVALGERLRTLVATGVAALSYVNEPETIGEAKSNVTGTA
jgi:hypothetical protein